MNTHSDPLTVRSLIASTAIFSGWPPHLLDRLLSQSRRWIRTEGCTLLLQGQIASGLIIILKGSVEVTAYSDQGQRYIRRFAPAGNLYGLVSVIDGSPSTFTYVAQTELELIFIPSEVFLNALASQPHLWKDVAIYVASVQRSVFAAVSEQMFEGVNVRLVRIILTLTQTHGILDSETGRIRIRVTQEQLGNFLGVTRQTIHKELKHLEKLTYIALEYGELFVLDKKALEEIRDGSLKPEMQHPIK